MIEFCDLKAQQARIKDKIDAGIQRVLAHGQYILGPEVSELEEKLGAFVGAKYCISVANGTDALQIAQMALGIGPVGAAFFTWDIGMKKGDIQFLGIVSYAAPLLSTLALVAAGQAEASWYLGLAALLITCGAALASWKRP